MFARKTQNSEENIREVKGTEVSKKDAGLFQIFAGHSQGDSRSNQVINNSQETQNQNLQKQSSDPEKYSAMSAAAVLQLFAKKKCQSIELDASIIPKNFDPRSLFTNSAKKVPQNSDADSDE